MQAPVLEGDKDMAAHPQTWVLLRGLGRDAEHWGEVPSKLEKAIPGSRVLTPDLPGAGVLHEQQSPLSVNAMARAVRASLFGDRKVQRLRLAGLSLGSMVALAWAQKWPDEVDALALLSASIGGLCPPWWRCKPAALAAFVNIGWTRSGAARETKVLNLTSSSAEVREQALPMWTAIAAKHPVTRMNLARQLVAASLFRPRLAPLLMPTRILAAAQDRIVDLRCAAKIGEALGAPVLIHPTAGHDVPLDAPDWLVGQLASLSENVTEAL